MKLLKTLLGFLAFSFCAGSLADNTPNPFSTAPVVIAFTRHTFRGPDESIAEPLPSFSNLSLKNNVVAYEMNATSHGLKIAQAFAEQAYNNGAQLALKTIGENPKLAGKWSSIRADLSTERTFETGVYLDRGLSKNVSQNIAFTGVPVIGDTSTDDISTISAAQSACYPAATWAAQSALIKNQAFAKYTPIEDDLIELLGGTPDATPQSFPDALLVASLVEFNSDFNHFSLSNVVSGNISNSPETTKQAIQDSLNIAGYGLFQDYYGLTANVFSAAKVNYINTLPAGSQQIIVTHDDNINALLQSLGLISIQSKASDLAVYPLETITFALNSSNVAIVRTRININPNGSMTGSSGYKSWIIWSGTRAQWNAKVAAIQNNINQYPSIASCLAKIPATQPAAIDLRLG